MMLLVRDLAVLALLAVACSAGDGFYFPSQHLLLDIPDSKLGGGHGRRVSTSGDVPEGTSSNSGAVGYAGPPAVSTPAPSVPRTREPSRCMFAIVSCCRVGSIRVDEHCFDQFQCHGPFWGESPCRRESAVVAHNIVSKYYEAKEQEKREAEAAAAAAEIDVHVAAPAPRPEPEPSSPFDPIGPLPSREDAMRHG